MKKLFPIILLVVVSTICMLMFYQKQEASSDRGLDFPASELPEFSSAKSEAPDERRAFELLKRGGEISPLKVENARKKMRKLAKSAKPLATRDGGITAWQDLGPTNVGGRIRAIAIHPNDANTIFIGAAAGGIWRSTDGGTNWSLQNPVFQAYPVTSIAYDPFNSNIMYATTGEYRGGGPEFPGVGVLKSINGGSTWTVLPAPAGANFLWLSKVEMNPLLQNSLFVAGTTGDEEANSNFDGLAVLYRSNDGGQNWTVVWTSGVSDFIADLEMNPNDTSELIIGLNNQVRMSSNSGTNFITQMGSAPKITTTNNWFGQRCEVEYCANDPDNIYVSRHLILDANNNGLWEDVGTELWMSANGGSNWTMLSSTTGTSSNTNPLTSQGNYSHALWADPTDCSRALLGGIDLWKWQNNALTRITNWADDINGNSNGNNNSVHADFHVITSDPGYNGTTNRRVFLGNDGGIYSTADITTAGVNNGWQAFNSDLNITQLYGADISKSGDTIVGGAQDNSFFVDVNADNGLQTFFTFTTGDGGFSAINKSSSNIIFSSTQRGTVMRSTNTGTTFCQIADFDGGGQFSCCNGCPNFFNNGGTSDNPLFIAPLKLDPVNQSTVYLGARRLWAGANNGNNWSVIKGTIGSAISTIDIFPTNSNIMWVGHANGSVFRTNNGGGNWFQVDDNGIDIRDAYITDIAIHPLNSNKVIVTVGGFDDQHIYITEDNGANWVEASLGFDVHVETATWHPTIIDWVYVGTDVGMFASQDDGLHWSIDPVYGNNEGPVYTRIAELFWQGDGTVQYPYYLCAATHGRGLWRTFSPVIRELYVDKDCQFFCGLGSIGFPFKTFREALDKAGPGSRIVFKTAGVYEEGAPLMLVNENIDIVKADGVVGSVIIK